MEDIKEYNQGFTTVKNAGKAKEGK